MVVIRLSVAQSRVILMSPIRLSVILLSVILLSVILTSVIHPIVMAAIFTPKSHLHIVAKIFLIFLGQ